MNYEPQPGTIPHRAIAWLKSMRQIRPGYEPVTAEICEGIGVEVYGFTPYMKSARDQGAVHTRKSTVIKTLHWRIGDGTPDPTLWPKCPEEEPMHDAIQTLPRRFPPDGPSIPSFRALEWEGHWLVTGMEIKDGVAIFTPDQVQALKQVAA